MNSRIVKKGLAKIGLGKSKEYKVLEATSNKKPILVTDFKMGEKLEEEHLIEKQRSLKVEGEERYRYYELTGTGKIYFHNLQKEYNPKKKKYAV